jgi:hypothetical protein
MSFNFSESLEEVCTDYLELMEMVANRQANVTRRTMAEVNHYVQWLIESYPTFGHGPHPVDNLIPDVMQFIENEDFYLHSDFFLDVEDDEDDPMDFMYVSSDEEYDSGFESSVY